MPESKELGPLERSMRKRLGMPIPEAGPVTRIKNKRAEEEVKEQKHDTQI